MHVHKTRILLLVLIAAWTAGVVHAGGFHHHAAADPHQEQCPLNMVTVHAVAMPSPAPLPVMEPVAAEPLPTPPAVPVHPCFNEGTPLRGPPLLSS